jgi:hypothetical protein
MNKLLGAAAAAYLASDAVLAQPELELFASTNAQVELVQQITELRAQGGPNPQATIAPLRALALQYQEAGNDALAIVALEEARHVTRVHHGLSSADEALLLRQQIRSEQALGSNQRVWDLEQDMVTIARHHLDDIRMVPIFRELAEDRTEALAQYRAGYLPPEIYLGCYHAAPRPRYDDTRGKRLPPVGADGGCRTGSSDTVVSKLVWEILTYYADAIEVIVKNGDYASPELRELEKQALGVLRPTARPVAVVSMTGIAGINKNAPFAAATRCNSQTLEGLLALDLVGTCLEPVIRGNGFVVSNVGGWVGLVRLIAYEMRSGAQAADRATAIAELADWQLLSTPAERRRFGNGERALRLYERAYHELRQGGDVGASATQIFSPELPVTLPTFEPNPFASTATTASSRSVDVSFVVTKYGQAAQIAILETSNGATRAEARALTRLIESTTFRPRLINGSFAESAPVVVRYHLDP